MTLAEPNDQLPVIPVYEEPALVMSRATAWANALMAAVRQGEMFAVIQAKEYLEVEAWQLVATFAQAHAIPREPVALTDEEGRIYAYSCMVDVYQHGVIVGSGTSICGLDAFTSKDRSGTDQHKSAQSTAQTWAISRAIKNTFGFVAKLAGFETTPAEEMRSGGGSSAVSDPLMWCPIHLAEWFKRGKMREFAHPVDGVEGPRGGTVWCNQEEALGQLGERVRNAIRSLEWDNATATDFSNAWGKMNPTEKFSRLVILEENAEHRRAEGTPTPPPATDDPPNDLELSTMTAQEAANMEEDLRIAEAQEGAE